MDRNFDFKTRDQLKKMKEYRDISSDLRDAKLTSANGTTVTGAIIIDLITYISKGDLDLAIRGLRASKVLIDRCFGFLWAQYNSVSLAMSHKLLFEILRLEFISTKCVLDWDFRPRNLQLSIHRKLEQEVAQINVSEFQMNLTSSMRLERINQSIQMYEEMSFHVNQIWENLKKISQV